MTKALDELQAKHDKLKSHFSHVVIDRDELQAKYDALLYSAERLDDNYTKLEAELQTAVNKMMSAYDEVFDYDKLKAHAEAMAGFLLTHSLMHEEFGTREKGSPYDWAYGKQTNDNAMIAYDAYVKDFPEGGGDE